MPRIPLLLTLSLLPSAWACSEPDCPHPYKAYGDQCRLCPPGEERSRGICVPVLEGGVEGVEQGDAGMEGDRPIDVSTADGGSRPPSPSPHDSSTIPDADPTTGCTEDAALSKCVPLLTGLSSSAGTLTPKLTADTSEYSLVVGLTTQEVELHPTGSLGARVSINGSQIAAGESWTSDMLALGENRISIVVTTANDTERAYSLTVTRGYQQACIKASNPDASDHFGWSLAIAGDTLVVGAPGEDSGATGVDGSQTDNGVSSGGAVYVFKRIEDTWRQEAYLKPSEINADDEFGASVAISGDTIAVAAPALNRALAPGAVYVFLRSNQSWTQQARLTQTSTLYFGASIGLSGNLLIVGATGEGYSGVNGQFDGAAYVYTRNGTIWTQEARLVPAASQPGSVFGKAVAASGNTVAVGAPFDTSGATGVNGDQTDTSAPGSGAVYVFTRAGTTWPLQAYIKAANTGKDDNFFDVALDGDTLAVGAANEDGSGGIAADEGAPDSGAVYVFSRRNGAVWSQQAYLKALTPRSSDRFGTSLSISGDLIVVGAPQEDSAATGISENQSNDMAPEAGAAYVFEREEKTWVQRAYLKGSNTSNGDRFGLSVAASSTSIVVGAYGEDSSKSGIHATSPAEEDDAAASSGAIYAFPR